MRRLAALLLAGLILVGGGAALAAGDASDPLLTQSYFSATYIPDTAALASARVDAATAKIYDSAAARLKARADLALAKAGALSGGSGFAPAFLEQRFKRGDIVTIDTGSALMLLAGSATLAYDGGAVVDATAGTAVPSGAALTAQRHYLAGEDTLCRVTVTSDTAVLAPRGYYAVTPSGETDYNQLAGALKAMGVFKGTDTAYGGGYDLEKIPTRIEGLILFLRLVGEESAALNFTGPCPFVDVPDWCRAYVAYAYDKGYTKGVDAQLNLFGTGIHISAGEYITFVLRALGYRDSGDAPDFTWETALDKARTVALLTAGEHALLAERPFLRAQVAYVSYYALSATRTAGGTLQGHLTASGALNAAQVKAAMDGVTVRRIG